MRIKLDSFVQVPLPCYFDNNLKVYFMIDLKEQITKEFYAPILAFCSHLKIFEHFHKMENLSNWFMGGSEKW